MNHKAFRRQMIVLFVGLSWMVTVVLIPPCEGEIERDGGNSGRGLLWSPPITGSIGAEPDFFRHVDTRQLSAEMAAIACLTGIVIVGVGIASIPSEPPVLKGRGQRSSQMF